MIISWKSFLEILIFLVDNEKVCVDGQIHGVCAVFRDLQRTDERHKVSLKSFEPVKTKQTNCRTLLSLVVL